jgi:Zn-dependent M28 family amino/carboxypeptidase
VTVPGANDNLTGSLTAIAVLKHLQEEGIRFEHTEVACLITGSEEAGLRGAKAFAKAHREELTRAETVFVALESFRDTECMAVYNRDMSGTVRHHPGVCSLLQQAGKNCGFDLPIEKVYVGSTDAAAITQAGIPAAALAGMDPGPPRYYHTRLDHWKNMDPECLRRGFSVALEAVRLYDERGV